MTDPPDSRSETRREDARPRRTPYELVFTEGDFESVVFPRVVKESEEAEIDPAEPERFEFLTVAADLVREMTPEDAPPEALDQYRLLLFHAFNFWRSGRPLYVCDTAAARYFAETKVSFENWPFAAPAVTTYLQLPPNLFWSSISPDTTPEPIDGFFVTLAYRRDHREALVGHLEVLVVLGIRQARAGFSVIPVSTELGEGIEEVWASPPRSGGDFRNVLPGGEMAGLYSILTTDEVLKLVGRAFWHIAHHPEDLLEVPAAGPRQDGDPPPSHLAYTRVGLAGEDRRPDVSDRR